MRKMLAAKIHRATVTAANVDDEGSITVPPEQLHQHRPTLVFVNHYNQIPHVGPKVPGPQLRRATEGC